ncbi:phosphoethanolamine transferase [Celerinatantimonas yamalensis]|uniref:Phosphoethanolamine--lipid A transferase n=1 Tax=Celerinatantimonas yamalensis TaxID=559956 RepID=A0ABW9G4T7_9GAMM
MNISFKKERSYNQISWLLAIYFACIVNVPFYRTFYHILSNIGEYKIGFVITVPIFIVLALNFIFQWLIWPYITKPIFVVLLIVASIVSYASFNYGVVFDKKMIVNIFETNTSEANSYLSGYLLLWVLVMGGIPSLLLMLQPLTGGSVVRFILLKLGSGVFALAAIALIAAGYYQDYSSVVRNHRYLGDMIIPANVMHNTYRYVRDQYFKTPPKYQLLGVDAKQRANVADKPTLLVILMGETARSQNYQYNGYARPTNAFSAPYQPISFAHVRSCGTATAEALPCIFSRMDRSNYNRFKASYQDNALDIMQRAGISLLWKENDGGDKSVAQNIQKIEIQPNQDPNYCNGSTCRDMVMLDDFAQTVAKMKGNRVIVLHLIGSHGPTYYQRYPKSMAFFQPDCQRADIENCSVAQIVNSYDNTIRYTDFVLSQTIQLLSAQMASHYNSAVIYLSDHGESLGEHGLFLHGMPYQMAPAYQTHIPLLVWMSSGFIKAKGVDEQCLRKQAKTGQFSQDNLFDSFLGMMDVSTQVYRRNMDIFATCRNVSH